MIPTLFFIVAFLYSSVGHGGASGYLAILSFTDTPPDQMATTALILNLLVASISFISYWQARHFSWRLTWPFMISSVPAAFLGGLIHLPCRVYELLLSVVLIFAAIRLFMPPDKGVDNNNRKPGLPTAISVGAGIGFISGIVGIGGGIFLSPIILIMRWANAKQTAAASAVFIVVNALAGLLGRLARCGVQVGDLAPLLAAGCVGAVAGSYLGAGRFPGLALRRILAVVLLIAALKLATHS